MQSVSDPLSRFFEDGSWFARAHELRLWVVRCDASLRNPLLTMLPKLEFHADNRSAWPLLPDAHTREDDGWQLRANGLAADWSRRVEAFAAEGVEQGSVEPIDAPRGAAAFRSTVATVLDAMVEPLEGLVVVLAPSIVASASAFESELTQIVGDPALLRCRWVVALELDVAPPQALLDALGPQRALSTTCRVDPAQQRLDLAAMLAASPSRFGTAGPVGVEPPPRVDDPPPLPRPQRDQALKAAGVDPALLDDGPQIRAKVIGAALAMKEQRGTEAIELQRQARDLCAGLGEIELQVITQITLASYLGGLDQRRLAIQELRAAIETARAHDLLRLESQAHLAAGMLHALDREPAEAMRSYTEAARVAERAEEPVLAIEAWRTAGQLAAGLRQEQAAASALHEALKVAAAASPAQIEGSSAPEAARRLAAIYEQRGMSAQADSLYAQADAMERGEGLIDAGQ